MHFEKVTISCGLKNDCGQAITFNDKSYRSMIDNFFWPELENVNINDM